MVEESGENVKKNITLEDIINYINNNPLPLQTSGGVFKGPFHFYPTLEYILKINTKDLLTGLLETYKNRMIKLLRGKLLEYYIIYYLRAKGFNVVYNYLRDLELGVDFTVIFGGQQKFFYVGADSKLTRIKLKKLIDKWRKKHIYVNILLYTAEDVEEVNGWLIPKSTFLDRILKVIKNEPR